MSDTPINPAPENPDDQPKKRQRGEINAKYLAEYELADDLVIEASIEERIALLTERGWPPSRVATFSAHSRSLERAALLAVGRINARKMDTEEKKLAREAMLDALHPIRTGAKRTYRGTGEETGRDAFYVNEPTNVSLERLLFIANQILLKITPQPIEHPVAGGPTTTPPEIVLDGVIARDITALETTRDSYIEARDGKNKTDGESQEAHNTVEQIFLKLRAERIDLQLGADQAYPHTAPNGANNATRRSFKIPENRPATE